MRLCEVEVEVIPLDSLLQQLGTVKPVVLKIDVEGFGLNVVRGATEVIKSFRPFIFFEVHRTFDELDEMRALQLLKDMGYGLKLLDWRSKINFIIFAYPAEIGCVCCE